MAESNMPGYENSDWTLHTIPAKYSEISFYYWRKYLCNVEFWPIIEIIDPALNDQFLRIDREIERALAGKPEKDVYGRRRQKEGEIRLATGLSEHLKEQYIQVVVEARKKLGWFRESLKGPGLKFANYFDEVLMISDYKNSERIVRAFLDNEYLYGLHTIFMCGPKFIIFVQDDEKDINFQKSEAGLNENGVLDNFDILFGGFNQLLLMELGKQEHEHYGITPDTEKKYLNRLQQIINEMTAAFERLKETEKNNPGYYDKRFLNQNLSTLVGVGTSESGDINYVFGQLMGQLKAAQNGWNMDELCVLGFVGEVWAVANKQLSDYLLLGDRQKEESEGKTKINEIIDGISMIKEKLDDFKADFWDKRVITAADRLKVIASLQNIVESCGEHRLSPAETFADRYRLLEQGFSNIKEHLVWGDLSLFGKGDKNCIMNLIDRCNDEGRFEDAVSRMQYAFISIAAQRKGSEDFYSPTKEELADRAVSGKADATAVLVEYVNGDRTSLASLCQREFYYISETEWPKAMDKHAGTGLYFYCVIKSFMDLLRTDRNLYEAFVKQNDDHWEFRVDPERLLRIMNVAGIFVLARASEDEMTELAQQKRAGLVQMHECSTKCREAKQNIKDNDRHYDENIRYLDVLNVKLLSLAERYVKRISENKRIEDDEKQEMIEELNRLTGYIQRAREKMATYGELKETLAAKEEECMQEFDDEMAKCEKIEQSIEIREARDRRNILAANIAGGLNRIDKEGRPEETVGLYEYLGTPAGRSGFDDFVCELDGDFPDLYKKDIRKEASNNQTIMRRLGVHFFDSGKKFMLSKAANVFGTDEAINVTAGYALSLYMEYICREGTDERIVQVFENRAEFEKMVTEFIASLRFKFAGPQAFVNMLIEAKDIFINMTNKMLLAIIAEKYAQRRDNRIADADGKIPNFDGAFSVLKEGESYYGRSAADQYSNGISLLNDYIKAADEAYSKNGVFPGGEIVSRESALYSDMKAYRDELHGLLGVSLMEEMEKLGEIYEAEGKDLRAPEIKEDIKQKAREKLDRKEIIKHRTIDRALKRMKARIDFDHDAPTISENDKKEIEELREYVEAGSRKFSLGMMRGTRRSTIGMINTLTEGEEKERDRHLQSLIKYRNIALLQNINRGNLNLQDGAMTEMINKTKDNIVNSVMRSFFLEKLDDKYGKGMKFSPDEIRQVEKEVGYELKVNLSAQVASIKRAMTETFGMEFIKLVEDAIERSMLDHETVIDMRNKAILATCKILLKKYRELQIIRSPRIEETREQIFRVKEDAELVGASSIVKALLDEAEAEFTEDEEYSDYDLDDEAEEPDEDEKDFGFDDDEKESEDNDFDEDDEEEESDDSDDSGLFKWDDEDSEDSDDEDSDDDSDDDDSDEDSDPFKWDDDDSEEEEPEDDDSDGDADDDLKDDSDDDSDEDSDPFKWDDDDSEEEEPEEDDSDLFKWDDDDSDEEEPEGDDSDDDISDIFKWDDDSDEEEPEDDDSDDDSDDDDPFGLKKLLGDNSSDDEDDEDFDIGLFDDEDKD